MAWSTTSPPLKLINPYYQCRRVKVTFGKYSQILKQRWKQKEVVETNTDVLKTNFRTLQRIFFFCACVSTRTDLKPPAPPQQVISSELTCILFPATLLVPVNLTGCFHLSLWTDNLQVNECAISFSPSVGSIKFSNCFLFHCTFINYRGYLTLKWHCGTFKQKNLNSTKTIVSGSFKGAQDLAAMAAAPLL